MNMRRKEASAGYTLFELMISLALLLVISGAVFGVMGVYQKNYRGTELKVSVDQQMRSALELMSQEIGQAGLPLSRLAGSRTDVNDNALVVKQGIGFLNRATTVGDEAPVTIDLPAGMTGFPFYPDQRVIIDTAGSRESAVIRTVDKNSRQVTFGDYSQPDPDFPIPPRLLQFPHNAGDPLISGGLYPEGILWWDDGTYTATARTDTFTGYELWLYGDLTNSGQLDLISYTCDATTKRLLRTSYDTSATSCAAPPANGQGAASKPVATANARVVTLLDNVTNCDRAANLPPFTVVPWFGSGWIAQSKAPNINNKGVFTFITSVSITLQTQSLTNDPRTKKPVTLTKSLLNIQPRNILSGFRRESKLDLPEGDTSDFQPNPQYGVFKCFPID